MFQKRVVQSKRTGIEKEKPRKTVVYRDEFLNFGGLYYLFEGIGIETKNAKIVVDKLHPRLI